jgi:WD40 repeat protein
MRTLPHRYPGVQPFGRDQASLFFGRHAETSRLLTQVTGEKLTVLFGKSGYGKSSLVFAGLVPALEQAAAKHKRIFLPVPIRFNAYHPKGGSLLEKYLFHRRQFVQEQDIPLWDPLPDLPATLWGDWKSFAFTPDTTLILIFDQFEEFFSYPTAQQEDFRRQLSELLYSSFPTYLEEHEDQLDTNQVRHLEHQLDVRALFVIRSDWLSELNSMQDYLPSILHSRVELGALAPEQARAAVVGPASLTPENGDNPYFSPPFAYAPAALAALIDGLQNATTSSQKGIEAFLLQVLCTEIEEKVAGGQVISQNEQGRPLVQTEHLPDPKTIFSDYYQQRLSWLQEDAQVLAREVIEDGLVQVNELGEGRRLSVDGGALINNYPGLTKALLNQLVHSYLLRRAPNALGGQNYELSHDTLLEPVIAARRVREEAIHQRLLLEEQRKRRRATLIATLGFLLAAIALVAGGFAWRQTVKAKAEQTKAERLAKANNNSLRAMQLERTNPVLALRLAETNYLLYPESRSAAAVFSDIISQFNRGKPLLEIKSRSPVTDAMYSPDGQQIISTHTDASVQIWSLSGDLLNNLQGHTELVKTLDISAQGDRIITGSNDSTAIVWSSQGDSLFTLRGHQDQLWAVAISPDGQKMATGARDGTVMLWSDQGRLTHTFTPEKDLIFDLAFSPDGEYLLAGTRAGVTLLWNRTNGRLKEFQHHSMPVTSVAFSPDGQSILTGGSDDLAIQWRLLSGEIEQIYQGHTGSVESVSFSPDGQTVLTSSYDETARLWDLQGKELAVFASPKGRINNACFSPDGKEILTAPFVNSILRWSVIGQQLRLFHHRYLSVFAVACSPNGKQFASAGDGYFREINLWSDSGEKLREFSGHHELVNAIVFSPDGQYILSGSEDSTAILWSLDSDSSIIFKGHESGVRAVDFLPDGSQIVTGTAEGVIRFWDLDGQLVRKLTTGENGLRDMQISPDGKHLAVIPFGSKGQVWNLATGDSIWLGAISDFGGAAVCWSPDGKHLLIAEEKDQAVLWDLTGNEVLRLRGGGEMTAVAISPDGRYFLTASHDNAAKLWDSRGNELQTFLHLDLVTSLAFSPDGRYIFLGSWDQTASLWMTPWYYLETMVQPYDYLDIFWDAQLYIGLEPEKAKGSW